MPQLSAIVASYYPDSERELVVGGTRVSKLAAEYGTPLYIYDASAIDKKWEWLRAAMPPCVSICYSVKANPLQVVLKHFLKKQAGLEIASAGEYCQVLKAGCSPEHIIFAGPGKTDAELETVLRHGIGEIHLESLQEAKRLNLAAQNLAKQVAVGIRVNPGGEAEGGAMRMGGRSAAFGIDEEAVSEFVRELAGLSALRIQGIHLFTGTQILDYRVLANQYSKGLQIARAVARQLGRPLQTLDFGGGLGIPYFLPEAELDMHSLKGALAPLFEAAQREPLFAGTQFLIEPGRYLVGEAGIYITRVTDIKVSRGKTFVILDGGMNHHLAASGNLGQTIKRNYPVALLGKLKQTPAAQAFELAGPLCTPLDILARNVQLPEPEIGDLLGVFQSGAYGRSASPLGFLSHAAPAEVWVENGRHRLVRRRGQLEDYLADQLP